MINHVNKDAKLHQVHQVTQKSCLFFTVWCSVLELQHFSLAPQTYILEECILFKDIFTVCFFPPSGRQNQKMIKINGKISRKKIKTAMHWHIHRYIYPVAQPWLVTVFCKTSTLHKEKSVCQLFCETQTMQMLMLAPGEGSIKHRGQQ